MCKLRKIVVSIILITVLLYVNLCPAAAAAGISPSVVPSEDISPVMGEGYSATPSDLTLEKLPAANDVPATSSDAEEESNQPDEPAIPDGQPSQKEPATGDAAGVEAPMDTAWEEASTMDELEDFLWKMEKTGGNIRVTDNLLVSSDITFNFILSVPDDKRIIVDLGSHTLYVDGTLRVTGGAAFIGLGGEQGLIHVNQGGNTRFDSAVVFQAATENDCTLYQETGATLLYEHNESSVGKVHREPLPEAEAATFEELMHLAETMSGSGGTIQATADLVVPMEEDREYSLPRNSNDNADTALLVDMGEHTLFVEGKLRLQTGVKLIGGGGENGLVRVRTGGEVRILDATLQAESGYTVWQEEGAIFIHTPTSDDMGQIHYAESPVAVPDSYTSRKICLPVAVVLDQQKAEDILPKTDSVRLYQNGLADNGPSDDGKEISVSWDLEQYREQLAARERVLITGSYPDAVAFAEPTCLVVFQNGNPAIFLDCWGTESYGRPGTKIKVKLMKPELGCRFEWSQDGKNWLAADAKQSETLSDDQLAFNITFPQGVPPSYPYYLSAVVDDPDSGAGYSDVMVIREVSTLGDNGGNRGGGTDLGPPQLPPPGNDTDIDDNDDTDTSPDKPQLPGNGADSDGNDDTNTSPPDNSTMGDNGGATDIAFDEPEPAGNGANVSNDTVTTPGKPELPDGNSMGQPAGYVSSQTEKSGESAAPSLEQEKAEPVVSAAISPEYPVSQPEENFRPVQAAPASRAKVIAQMLAGIAATGTVVLLTITWSPKAGWGKRLKQLLHSLLKR